MILSENPRINELLKKFSYKRNDFISRLANGTYSLTQRDFDRGKEIYELRKKEGTLPYYCRVLENLKDNSLPCLRGKINDPVYDFLLDIRKEVKSLFHEKYPLERVLYEDSRVYDLAYKNEEGFVSSVIDFFENRGFDFKLPKNVTPYWIGSTEITKKRYNFLRRKLSKKNLERRQENIIEFISFLPRKPWENFDWEMYMKN